MRGYGSREAREGLPQPPEGRGRTSLLPARVLVGTEDTFQMKLGGKINVAWFMA